MDNGKDGTTGKGLMKYTTLISNLASERLRRFFFSICTKSLEYFLTVSSSFLFFLPLNPIDKKPS